MHKTEPSQLQSLSLQLADKLHNLVENNDRVLDQKPFFQRNNIGGGFRDRRWGGQQGRDRNNQDERGGRRNDYQDNRRGGHQGRGQRDGGDRGNTRSFLERF